MSGPASQRHTNGADRFRSSLCVNFHWLCYVVYLLCPSSGSLDPGRADTQGFYFWQMPEHGAKLKSIFISQKIKQH